MAGEVKIQKPTDMGTSTFNFAYDPIGNRLAYTNGATVTAYLSNELNQYTQTVVAAASTRLRYDLDGNLTNDGTYAYTWDDENRLYEVWPTNMAAGSKKLRFDYDSQGRRVRKAIFTRSGGAWTATSTNVFAYDGWNAVVQVGIPPSGTWTTNYFAWGLDLSGSLQAAGGIGGLIAWSRRSDSKTFLCCYDGNGNVTELYAMADGRFAIAARYIYDPFGGTTTSTGTEAANAPFRFSTKYCEDNLGLYCFTPHPYSAVVGRWLNRLAHDTSRHNVYLFAANQPLDDLETTTIDEGAATPAFAMAAYGEWKCFEDDGPGEHRDTEARPLPPTERIWINPDFSKSCLSPCFRPHEEQHERDMGSCCEKAQRVWQDARSRGDTWAMKRAKALWRGYRDSQWARTECNAYRVSVKCYQDLFQKNCECAPGAAIGDKQFDCCVTIAFEFLFQDRQERYYCGRAQARKALERKCPFD